VTAKALMIMGTGSDVGKSLIAAGLCRAFANRGLTVRPFKPQNMSNNAAVTADGGEIGRAQALQARACRTAPTTAMNPVLLKPEQETGAQLIVRGTRRGSLPARDYFATRQTLMPDVLGAFNELAGDADLVIIEGAGSAAEVNLRDGDLANFGFARAAGVPVVLLGDIHRGGVIASIIGTFAIIAPEDADLVVGSMINKFHGDPALFADGLKLIADRTGRPCFGPIPHFADAVRLPAEDALALDTRRQGGEGTLHIAVPRLARIANFDDLDPLAAEPDVRLTVVQPGEPIPRDADLVIIPGSKATLADLAFVRAQGWDIDIAAHHRAGGHVLGICGGYQMLGQSIADPDGVEGPAGGRAQGLGLLNVGTELGPQKRLTLENATEAGSGLKLAGYRMHMGETTGPDTARPFSTGDEGDEGARAPDGRVAGTYLHGLFASDGFRSDYLARLGATAGDLDYESGVETALDGLAAHLDTHLDLDMILALAREPGALGAQ
jgi:adenosylcobyric acid synthase